MYLTCPNCNFSKEVPDDRIPPRARTATCPRCRTKFPLPPRDQGTPGESQREAAGPTASTQPWPSSSAPYEEQKGGPEHREGVAWESESSDRGMWLSLLQTIRQVLFSPGKFYASLNPWGKVSYALAFAVITGGAGELLSLFWQYLIFSQGFSQFAWPLVAWLGMGSFMLLTLLIPVLVVIGLVLGSASTHLGLIILRGNTYPFRATFKVLAYSHAAHLLNVVPMVGALIWGIWALVLGVIGLGKVHRISMVKAFFALILIPLLLVAGMVLVLILPWTGGTLSTA